MFRMCLLSIGWLQLVCDNSLIVLDLFHICCSASISGTSLRSWFSFFPHPKQHSIQNCYKFDSMFELWIWNSERNRSRWGWERNISSPKFLKWVYKKRYGKTIVPTLSPLIQDDIQIRRKYHFSFCRSPFQISSSDQGRF